MKAAVFSQYDTTSLPSCLPLPPPTTLSPARLRKKENENLTTSNSDLPFHLWDTFVVADNLHNSLFMSNKNRSYDSSQFMDSLWDFVKDILYIMHCECKILTNDNNDINNDKNHCVHIQQYKWHYRSTPVVVCCFHCAETGTFVRTRWKKTDKVIRFVTSALTVLILVNAPVLTRLLWLDLPFCHLAWVGCTASQGFLLTKDKKT